MVMSVPMKSARQEASEISKTLKLADFNNTVTISLDDGSHFHWKNATHIYLSKNVDWVAVFTEHFGDFVFHYGDITSIEEAKPVQARNYL